MLNDVRKIKSIGIDQILNDPVNLILLLNTYSKLFLNGKQPSSCQSCIKKYYNQICLKGEEMAKVKESQTFTMSFEGIMYVPGVKKDGKFIALHKHINPKYVTDKEAIEMLNIGALNESHFKVLPDGYKTEPIPTPKKKTFTIQDLEKVLENAEFNQMRSVAKEMGINVGKNPKSEKLKSVITKAIEKLKK